MHAASRSLRVAFTTALAATLCIWVAAADAAAPPHSPAPATLVAKEAWIRWLPSGLPAGGYLTLANTGDRALVLIGASSDAYGEVALHANLSREGMGTMAPVHAITIPAHSVLNFAAAGYHLMLMQPSRPLSPGEHVSIRLQFADDQSLTVPFELREPNGSSAQSHDDMKGMAGMPGMQH